MECTYNSFFFICFSSGATKALTKNSSNLNSCKSVPHTDYNHTMLAYTKTFYAVFCLKFETKDGIKCTKMYRLNTKSTDLT